METPFEITTEDTLKTTVDGTQDTTIVEGPTASTKVISKTTTRKKTTTEANSALTTDYSTVVSPTETTVEFSFTPLGETTTDITAVTSFDSTHETSTSFTEETTNMETPFEITPADKIVKTTLPTKVIWKLL